MVIPLWIRNIPSLAIERERERASETERERVEERGVGRERQ